MRSAVDSDSGWFNSSRRVVVLVFLAALATNVLSVRLFGYWDLPPKNRDGVDYDNIALNLARGRGFGRYWGDPEFQEPYTQHNESGRYDVFLERDDPYSPTAYRPPGLPFMLAGVYKVFGRNFLIWRLINCTFIAVAVAMAAWLAWRLAGPWPAMVTAGIGICDPVLKKYAGYYLTEGPSTLLVMLLVWSLVMIIEHKQLRYAAAAGVAMASMVLMRSLFVMWYPLGLALVIWCWLGSRTQDRRRGVGAAAGVFLLLALALPAPWWARNCRVLDTFAPLGTQGGIGLPGGFSDMALAGHGVWINVEAFGFFDPLYDRFATRELTAIEWEREKMQYGQHEALTWIKANPWQIPRLAAYRLVKLWSKPTVYGPLLLVLTCFGLRWARTNWRVQVLWAFVVYNTLVVMATYVGGGGRFLMPIWLILFILVGVGVWRIIVGLGGDRYSCDSTSGPRLSTVK